MIVLGLGYGDEGKGLSTSFLCSQTPKPLVVRFNGGHQAGHTVVYHDHRHVFSSFGAGTLQGVPSYWSRYCTFFPTAVVNEHEALPIKPILYVDPLCPVTTPYDVYFNHLQNKDTQHGTVGVGFGATLRRHENYYKLYVQDLYYPKVLQEKLRLIAQYYQLEHLDIRRFLEDVELAKDIIRLSDSSIISKYTPVFEGAQGLLLDQDFGFFPHVTRSNTSSKNALNLHACKEVYYVTRTYQTRHGNGYLSLEDQPLKLINAEKETNVLNDHQGSFRKAPLDVEMLNYALTCDQNFSKHLHKNLIITCMDQHEINVATLLQRLNTKFDKVFVSYGDSFDNIVKF